MIRIVQAATVLVLVLVAPRPAWPQANSPFRNPRELRVSARSIERVDEATIAWGRNVLKELDVEKLDVRSKAEAIVNYIHGSCAFTPDRPESISDFLKSRKGNCYAHARLGAFLLRLSGVAAKFAYEIHLELKSPSSAVSARERGIGLFGQYHNDHFWVLYRDGQDWLPFDSALGIVGYEAFARAKIHNPQGGVANPPFIVWEDTGQGQSDMSNITESLWDRLGARTIRGVSEEEWQRFLGLFKGRSVEDFRKPIDPALESEIARVARPFFLVTDPQ